jgi:hypothetical protein
MFVLCAGWAIAAAVWSLVFPPKDLQGALLSILIPAWLLAGAGMNGALTGGLVSRTAGSILIVLLPIAGAVSHFTGASRERAETIFLSQYLERLRSIVPASTVFVSEDRVIDEQVAAWIKRRPSSGWGRVSQDPDAIRRALSEGRPVVTFAGARPNIEELGFRVTPITGTGVSMSVEEYLRAIPKGWLVAAATGDRFSLSMLPRRGPTFASIGGQIDLFGHSRTFFGIVGVRGRPRATREVEDKHRVQLAIAAGEPAADDVRAPASVGASSDEGGGTVFYDGAPVAHTATGLALAIVSTDGVLRRSLSVEADEGMRIVVDPPSLSPALVTGAEPCAVVAGTWTDVLAPAQLSSLGGILDGPSDLVIYLRSGHPLAPHLGDLPHQRVPALRVAAFRASDRAERESLRALVSADALTDPESWLAAPYVYRVESSSTSGRRQLALMLGGFPDGAVARGKDGGGAVTLCAAVRENRPAVSANATVASEEIDMANRDLFVFGWDRVERDGRDRFRWTRALEAEMLVSISGASPTTLELDCGPDGATDIELRVRVNGDTLPPATLELGLHRYRWTLPARAFHTGMNRLSIGTSALTRPMDVGRGADDRRLGVAVYGITLIR